MAYQNWAKLNIKGKKEWGAIFKDGKVPIQRISTQKAKLKGTRNLESILQVDWKALSQNQQQAIIDKLSKQKGTSKLATLKEITTVGLPIRSSQIHSVGTSQIEILPKEIIWPISPQVRRSTVNSQKF